jgi:hypothetical protein
LLFDAESHSKYESVRPGAVTVEGFAVECWAYELAFGKPKEDRYIIEYPDMPEICLNQLLRRIDELRRNTSIFGWSRKQEEYELRDILGDSA